MGATSTVFGGVEQQKYRLISEKSGKSVAAIGEASYKARNNLSNLNNPE